MTQESISQCGSTTTAAAAAATITGKPIVGLLCWNKEWQGDESLRLFDLLKQKFFFSFINLKIGITLECVSLRGSSLLSVTLLFSF